MDEIKASPPPQTTGAAETSSVRKQEASAMDRVKKGCVSLYASSQETLRYAKAFFAGWKKKLTARNEKEAAEADLQTAKMQVEATETAENMKKKTELK